MGGTTFTNTSTETTAQTAFNCLVEDARIDHGSSGYTGTIAEKPGFVIITRQLMSERAAHRLAQQLIDAEDERINDKWGVAGAIPLSDNDSFTRRTVKITLDHNYDGYLDDQTLMKLAQATTNMTDTGSPPAGNLLYGSRAGMLKPRIVLRDQERIEAVKVLDDKMTRKVTVKKTRGKVETRYYLVPSGRIELQGDGYASLTTAQQALQAFLTNKKEQAATNRHYSNPSNESWEIIGVARRSDGSSLAQGQLEITKRRLSLEVTLSRPKGQVKPGGWLFFGWASC